MKKEDAVARRKRLLSNPKSAYESVTPEELERMENLCSRYKDLLDGSKIERQCVEMTRSLAEQYGFKAYERGMKLVPGDKVYTNDLNKNVILAIIGTKSLDQGIHMIASHLDAPRLDLKPNALYEDSEQALFKTHYYGGIKKYQWMSIPLELRGVVSLKNGTMVDVQIGADPYDPVLVITDLLPHLGAEQAKKTIGEGFPAESLNALVGIKPDPEEGSERVKLAVLGILNEKYGIIEDDFRTAELSLVPATNARDVGLDRSMIGAYGQDDRSCAYAAMQAILETEAPLYTSICALVDKEEIGSEGVSGMNSAHFDTFIGDLCDMQGVKLEHCYQASFCLSGDVVNGYDPNFADAHDKRNNAMMGYGIGVFKYTGSRGKSGASDASCETMAKVRKLFDSAKVVWQTGELGKVDLGGGGTVAKFIAQRNIEVVDVGVPVLSMHAPFEITAKIDLYMCFKGFKAFYADKA